MKSYNDKNIIAVKFIVWLFILSSVMLFAGITSAYIVNRIGLLNANKWIYIQLPNVFICSNILLIISSITIYYANYLFNEYKYLYSKTLLIITFFIGIFFLILQLNGLKYLINNNIYLSGNVAGSYIYIISIIHGVHVIFGLLGICYYYFFIQQNNKYYTQTIVIYWHFITFSWLYLYCFMLLNR